MAARGRIRTRSSRLRRVLLPALLSLLVLPAPAAASLVLTGTDGRSLGGPFRGWVERTRVPPPEGRVTVSLRGCPRRPDLAGCVITRRPRKIYLRREEKPRRSVFFHELGHVFDLTVLGRRDRREFARIHGRSGRRWFRGASPPGEWFAEAYSLCARYGFRALPRASTTYGYRPSARTHRASCLLIRQAAARRRPQRPKAPPRLVEPAPPARSEPAPPPKRRDCLVICI